MQRIFLKLSASCFFILLVSFPSLINGTSKIVARGPFPVSKSLEAAKLAIEVNFLYDSLHLYGKGLSKQALEYALKGYAYLQKKGLLAKKSVLSICDFSQSSKNKRFYIIDVENKRLLLNTYVAHGRNSGSEYANSFSNKPESLKSSLGFYVTRKTYHGCHGLALKIDGLERGFNDKADSRNIVVHGSEYVGPDFIRFNRYSGRSFGCPALPLQQTPLVINTIKDGSCLFIYHPNRQYIKHSKILNS